MATARNYISRPRYRFLDADLATSMTRDSSSPSFELDESDLYNSPRSVSPGPCDLSAPNSRTCKKPAAATRAVPRPGAAAVASSLPVNVPDWSKILREEYRENRRRGSLENDFFDDEGEEEEDEGRCGNGGRNRRWVPPHELVARTARMASSFSVTLKGRDLSRVRNAIWAKTGFQD
ncbi:uncharacterized protein LOC115738223 [Rhodamnia argentea]|uniref:Uncharacterized protein LOC115738223 n=1 Tax=Rhodamnia argentea TaxID=178133 RepID=A0A8B8NY25_9MYRT|nr:uncharacterized protein LOC115738223 [Rhodamnia argentea]